MEAIVHEIENNPEPHYAIQFTNELGEEVENKARPQLNKLFKPPYWDEMGEEEHQLLIEIKQFFDFLQKKFSHSLGQKKVEETLKYAESLDKRLKENEHRHLKILKAEKKLE